MLTQGGGDLILRANGSNVMTLLQGGNVGIGTNNPTKKLDVRGGAIFNEGGLDADFSVKGTSNTNVLIVDASSNNVGIATGGFAPAAALTVAGDVILNSMSSNNDFTVRGDSDSYLLFSDASSDRIGIGTSTPSKKLDVNGDMRAKGYLFLDAPIDDSELYMEAASGNQGRVIVKQNNTEDVFLGDVDPTGGDVIVRANGSDKMIVKASGEVDIIHGTTNGLGMKIINSANSKHWVLHTDDNSSAFMRIYSSAGGNSHVGQFDSASGVYTATSDKRKKQNIGDVPNLLKDVLKLDVKTYKYKNDVRQKDRIGFLAQDVVEYFPQFVEYDEEEDVYTMDYAGLSAVAIKAIQEQNEIIVDYKSEIKILKNEMEEIRALLENQKSEE